MSSRLDVGGTLYTLCSASNYFSGFWYPWYELNFFLEVKMKVKIMIAVLGTMVVGGVLGTLFKFNTGRN